MSLSPRQHKLLAEVVKAAPIVLSYGGQWAATIQALEKRGLVDVYWERIPRGTATGHKWLIECRPTVSGVEAIKSESAQCKSDGPEA